jgi:hypothetical protein
MTFRQIKQKADQLRAIPLEAVLRACGARPDPNDKSKWHTAQGAVSITGAKFINWHHGSGGGGAIDLVIHLHKIGFKEALDWLERQFSTPPPALQSLSSKQELKLPAADPAKLWRVKGYLTARRAIPAALVDLLIQSGMLYADARANAVFLLLGKENIPVGAELRGTTDRPWRGMAPGSRKDLGSFGVPASTAAVPQTIILCESAIDALSCFVLHPESRCISTAGARPNPEWLPAFIAQGIQIYCGFDTDSTGERMAQAMISLHTSIKRIRPSHHDWNDTLTSQS